MVHVNGDLDHLNAPRLRGIISQLLEEGHENIVIDMGAVQFMDSGGMSGIIYGIKRLAQVNGHLWLSNCTPRIARKMEIGGLTKITDTLTLCASIEDAVCRK